MHENKCIIHKAVPRCTVFIQQKGTVQWFKNSHGNIVATESNQLYLKRFSYFLDWNIITVAIQFIYYVSKP